MRLLGTLVLIASMSGSAHAGLFHVKAPPTKEQKASNEERLLRAVAHRQQLAPRAPAPNVGAPALNLKPPFAGAPQRAIAPVHPMQDGFGAKNAFFANAANRTAFQQVLVPPPKTFR